MMKQQKRIEYIDTLRGVAISIVVATHLQEIIPVSAIATTGDDYELVGPMTIFFRNINIIFTFVSGYLFLLVDGDRGWTQMMTRKFKNIVVPYFFVSLPALALYILEIKNFEFGGEYNIFQKTIYFLLTGNHLGPLWFVPMIFVMFALSPIWKYLDRHRLYWIIVPLLVVSVLIGRPPENDNPIQAAVFFSPVFLFGMFTARYNEPLSRFFSSTSVMTACAFFTVAAIATLYFLSPSLTSLALNNTIFICKFPLLMLLFGMCARWSEYAPKWLTGVGLASYAIFLLHGYFVGALRPFVGHLPAFESMLMRLVCYVALCAFVVGACFLIAKVSRAATKPFNRLVIGY
ncbi:acyltransferase family protein [Agrobacterium cavarae]|uniref:acyltransferase family protein n=1 Tax=Agrobacterium cavarae TaxID=2528239 RepID=UPI003FD3679F